MKLFSVLTFWICLAGLPISAQTDAASATLRGIVLDSTGGGVSGATLSLLSTDRGTSFSAQAKADGSYSFPLLPPGTYTLTGSANGFQRTEISGLDLTVGQVLLYDVHLALGKVESVIEVSAAAPTVEVEQVQQANTVGERTIDGLPNLTRNFAGSLYTLPGVSSSSAPITQNAAGFTPFFSSGFSIGGSNGRNNLVTIDGGENEYGDGGLRTPNISQESVQEFQMNRNSFAAEFGFTAGTALNVITKGGSNEFHGSVYAYFMDEDTAARNYFSFVPGKPFEQHFFPGVALGGPIIKNKLFFFASYEYRRLNTPQFRNYTGTPETQGIGVNSAQQSYLNALLASGNPYLMGFAGTIQPLLSPMNVPYVAALLDANSGVFEDSSTSHDLVLRVDYQPDANDTVMGRFDIERYRYSDIGASSLIAPSDAGHTQRNDNAILVTWNHIFGPSVVNTARVQAVPSNTSNLIGFDPNSAQLSLGSLGAFNSYFGQPYNLDERRFQFEDSVALIKGTHSAKFGASYRPVHYDVTNSLWFNGEFDFFDGAVPLIDLAPAALQGPLATFNQAIGLPATGNPLTNLSALQSFALGLPVDYRQGFGNPNWQSWANYLGLYAQDSWRPGHGVTIDYGLRYDYDAEPAPVPHNGYFSPRIGVAWDPIGDGKTVIRAGAGTFVSPVYFQVPYLVNLLNDSGQHINQVATQLSATNLTAPGLWALGLAEGKLPFGQIGAGELAAFGLTPGPGGAGRVIFNLAPNYKNNYSIQTSFSVQRQLAREWSMELSYLRYRGVHLQLSQETNYYETGQSQPTYGPIYAPINPTIAQANTYSSIGSSTYNGMTASLTKHYSHNLQFQANYTFSRAIDDVTDFNSQFSSFWPTRLYLERGLSAFNVKHNFVANAVYTTPGPRWVSGITVSPIVTARSGIPFSVTVPAAENGTVGHSLYARPIYIPRDSGIGPNFYSVDMRVAKAFPLGEKVRLSASVEAVNLLNHTNFLSVNNIFSLGDPRLVTGPFDFQGSKSISPGDPLGFTAASNARQFQFGLKFGF